MSGKPLRAAGTGSGGAAMAAALEAVERGAPVTLLERGRDWRHLRRRGLDVRKLSCCAG